MSFGQYLSVFRCCLGNKCEWRWTPLHPAAEIGSDIWESLFTICLRSKTFGSKASIRGQFERVKTGGLHYLLGHMSPPLLCLHYVRHRRQPNVAFVDRCVQIFDLVWQEIIRRLINCYHTNLICMRVDSWLSLHRRSLLTVCFLAISLQLSWRCSNRNLPLGGLRTSVIFRFTPFNAMISCTIRTSHTLLKGRRLSKFCCYRW